MSKLVITSYIKARKDTRLYKAVNPAVNQEFFKYIITGKVEREPLDPPEDLWEDDFDRKINRIVFTETTWLDLEAKKKFDQWMLDSGYLQEQRDYNQKHNILRKVISEEYIDD